MFAGKPACYFATTMSALSFLRTATTAGFALVLGTVISTSCATPEFDFGDGPSMTDGNTGGTGGTGSGGVSDGGSGGGSSGSGSGGTVTVPHCENREVDADETDTDCGGNDCNKCGLGRKCEVASDCVNDACWGMKCQNPTCTDDYKNGTETDENCGGDECGPCDTDARCVKASDCASQVCQSGKCKAPTCTDRKQNQSEVDVDCGGECDPCDVGMICVVDGDCKGPDAASENPGTPNCSAEKACELVCPIPSGDCNEKAADGCETNTNTSVDHCGACGDKCAPAHATGQCVGGTCGILVCSTGYADINGNAGDGCEVNHLTDPEHCGVNANDLVTCSDEHGTPACNAGVCTIDCAAGYDDCNENVADGCEANLSKDVFNCTGCGNECPGGGNLSPFCDATDADGNGDPCGTTTCGTNLGDCNGDGVCTDNLTTIATCGSCGTTCTTTHGTPACTNTSGYQCSIAACDSDGTSDWEDCDGLPSACEVDILNNNLRCGGCLLNDAKSGNGKNCTLILSDSTKHVASIDCDSGTCKILSCTGTWADCDGSFDNGCEINTATSTANCGGCKNPGTTWSGGADCANVWANGDGICDAGVCTFGSCDANRADCNNDKAAGASGNGCETTTNNNPANCGGCGFACTKNANTPENECIGTTCVPSCVTGMCPSTDPKQGCTNPLGTSANCTSCGNVCQGSTPYCHAGVGCRSYKKIRLVQSQTVQFLQPNGAVTGTTTNNFAIGSAATGHRLLVVAVSSIGNPGHVEPTAVTYGANKTLTQLTEANETTAAKYAALYYLKECDLVAAGDQKVTVTLPVGNGNGAVFFHAVLFENVEQTPTAVTSVVTSNSQTISLPGVTIPVDGWFMGAASGQQAAFSVTAPAGQTQTSAIGGAGSHKAIATAWGPMPASSYTFTWTANWDALAAVGMPLVPATTAAVSCP